MEGSEGTFWQDFPRIHLWDWPHPLKFLSLQRSAAVYLADVAAWWGSKFSSHWISRFEGESRKGNLVPTFHFPSRLPLHRVCHRRQSQFIADGATLR